MARNSGRFRFDGGAGTYLGTGLLAFLVTLLTLGLCAPFGIVLKHRWRAKHTYIDGQRLIFTGSAWGLFGHYLKWWLLTIITLGIYGFWVIPRITKWVVENTDFDPTYARPPVTPGHVATAIPPQVPPSLPASDWNPQRDHA
jgi:uncharacterized membrane protein YjgN (DUF898 family)